MSNILSKIRSIISVAKTSISGSKKAQVFEYGNIVKNLAVKQIYGLTSRGKKDFESLTLIPNAASDKAFILGALQTFEGDIGDGEVVVWSNFGQVIYFKDDGSIEISSKNKPIKVKAGGVELVLNESYLEFNGEIKAKKVIAQEISDSIGSLGNFRIDYKNHVHTGNQGAPTSPPVVVGKAAQ